MTYVMSDLHGQYEKYRKMLETIRFSDDDDLYILGDVVDRGEQSVEILQDMSMRINVYPILRNHDLMAARLLRRLCTEITEENYAEQINADVLQVISAWMSDGGDTTLKAFRKLPPDEREALLDYMEEFLPYDEIEVKGRTFVLVHGGIPEDRIDVPLEEQDVNELITVRPNYRKRYFEDRYLVSGHTPTFLITSKKDGKILRVNGHIAIDCGAAYDRPLGCLRLEDFREFYVR